MTCGILLTPIMATGGRVTLPIMQSATFYDGYLTSEIIDKDLDDGILRHANSLYSIKLNDSDLDFIGKNLILNLELFAQCDNYDRMGKVHLAFVPKGEEKYNYDDVERIEIGRFITPFMNKNYNPTSVNYSWDIPEVSYIFHDPEIRDNYDIWVETYLFGIPYDAQKKVKGCSDRNDVFSVSLNFSYDENSADDIVALALNHHLTPIYTTKSELYGNVNLNNYNPVATDEVGVTSRTFTFDTEKDYSDARLTFILTNHGAGPEGEEYNRRLHHIYVDGELLMSYTPGGVSCEPYRIYNTQGNMIYDKYPPMTEEEEIEFWEWNNWCPGSAQPIRHINLGALKAGEHSVRIFVPDAVFNLQDGDYRPSIYLQGMTEGTLDISGIRPNIDQTIKNASFERVGDIIYFSALSKINEVRVYADDGTLLLGEYNPGNSISIESIGSKNPLLIVIFDENGNFSTFKTVR